MHRHTKNFNWLDFLKIQKHENNIDLPERIKKYEIADLIYIKFKKKIGGKLKAKKRQKLWKPKKIKD